MANILVGTESGIHVFEDGNAGSVQFPDRKVTALGREGWALWTILDGRELWHTAGVDRWSHVWWFHVRTLDDLRANCLADTIAGVIVGTSEAHLLRVAGEGLERVGGFDEVDGRAEWYTPWGGPPDSRSISEDEGTVHVNVHVGGIVRSRDFGETWEPTIDIHADVHKVWALTPRVYAACAQGLAVSKDQGDSWTMRDQGLHSTYSRGVAVCGDTVLVSTSDDHRGEHAAVYRGRLDGGPLEKCRQGLPEWFDGNIDSYWLDAIPELAAFGTPDGRVFASTDEGATWGEVASGLPGIRCLLVMPT